MSKISIIHFHGVAVDMWTCVLVFEASAGFLLLTIFPFMVGMGMKVHVASFGRQTDIILSWQPVQAGFEFFVALDSEQFLFCRTWTLDSFLGQCLLQGFRVTDCMSA
jgi:hypothetical protein